MAKVPLKKLPILRTDEEAEQFVAEANLTEYDLSSRIRLSELERRLFGKDVKDLKNAKRWAR